MASNHYIDLLAPYIRKSLYPYQLKFGADPARWRKVNKSRQIGFSYSVGVDVIQGGLIRERNQLITSASKLNAEIVMDYIREHMDNLGLLPAVDKAGHIELPNGRYIQVCSTNWRTARGFNGDVTMDELAFTIRADELWRAIIPSITAVNGRVTVISSPKSRIDKFWNIWDNKSTAWSAHCVTIHDAIKDGFPVVLEELRELFDPEEFAQAYECVPLDTAESYIPYTLIEPCLFDPLSDAVAASLYADQSLAYVYGVDIGRSRDETAVAETVRKDGVTWCLGMKAWQKTPFAVQKERLRELLSRPQTQIVAIDKGGIGMNLHEDLAFAFPAKVRGVSFAPAVTERLARRMRIACEETKLRIPNDPSLISHILSIKRTANRSNTFSYGADRDAEHHGDKFWALALALDYTEGNRVLDFRFI